jgi:hypothetical protein
MKLKSRKHCETSLVPPAGRLWARTAADAARISAALLEPLLGAQSQLAVKLGRRIFAMNEIAEPSSDTPFSAIETTTRFSEICNGG